MPYGEGVRAGGWLKSRRPESHRPRQTDRGTSWALVVRVEDVGPAVADCRRRFDPAAAVGMPAHVTVLYPLPTYDETLAGSLADVVGAHEAFAFELATLGHFRRVVYLCPKPAEPFVRLTEAAAACLDVAPYGGQFDRVVPHVTVAMRRRLPRGVRRALLSALPIRAVATAVDVLGAFDDRWTVVDSLPLGQPSAPG